MTGSYVNVDGGLMAKGRLGLMSAEIDQYLARGYWIFRGIVPPTLLRDIRRQADVARTLAHELNGPQTQRIQPLTNMEMTSICSPFETTSNCLRCAMRLKGYWGRDTRMLTSISWAYWSNQSSIRGTAAGIATAS